MKILKALGTTAIVPAIALALLAVLEFALRLSFPGEAADAGSLDPIAYAFNEHFQVALKPKQVKYFSRAPENGGYISRWQTNIDGFRGAELQHAPTHRVMVYGDSNVQARFSGVERSFAGQLQRRLSEAAAAQVEVVNAGVVGFGPDQSLIRFSQEADKYRPDRVIVHVFADNDFGDIIRNRLFDLDQDGELVRTRHPQTVDPDLIAAQQRKLKTFVASLLIVSKTTELLAPFFGGVIDSDTQARPKTDARRKHEVDFFRQRIDDEFQLFVDGAPKDYSHFADHYDLGIALEPDSESSRTKIRLMAAVLTRARDTAAARGIGFLVLIQPSVIDLTPDNVLLNYRYLSRFPGYHRRNLSNAIERICIDNEIDVVNLFDVFDNADPARLYFRGRDDHWTDRGQFLAAREVADYLTQGMLKTASP